METEQVKEGISVETIIKINQGLELIADVKDLTQDICYQTGKLKSRTEKIAERFNKHRKKLLIAAQEDTNAKLKNNELSKSDLITIQEFSLGRSQWHEVEAKIDDYLQVQDKDFTVPTFKQSDFNYNAIEEDDGKKTKVSKNAATSRFISLMGDYLVK